MELEILLTNKHGQPMLGYDPEQNAVVLIPGLATGSGVGGAGGAQPATYLEGQWTPRLASTAGAEGQAYAEQAGMFVKVGRLVWLAGAVLLEARGTLSGEVLLKGLPFPVSVLPYVEGIDIGAIAISKFSGLLTPKVGLQGLPLSDQNAVALLSTDATGSAPLLEGDLSDVFAITFGGWYATA